MLDIYVDAGIYRKDVDSFLEKVKEEVSFNVSYISFSDLKPCLGIVKDGKIKVKFYGLPKFESFIQTIEIFTEGSYTVSERIMDLIDMVDRDVNIKVFTTNACGWCHPAVIKAVSFSYLSNYIYVGVFDCYSFSDLATSYNVVTVPKTVINDKVEFFGVKDDNEFLGYIIKAIQE